jgi:protein-L-isoaspartate(D-aspartate) O-methyltransferase
MIEDEFTQSRRKMVEQQIRARGIRNPAVLAAMQAVPRHRFLAADELAWAYSDGPLPIGHWQTISQPYIVALMTELLELAPTDRVLEVGTGCGYQAAVLAELAAEVHSIELLPDLAEQARGTLVKLGYTGVRVHTGDGSCGYAEAAPYDAILVAAAAPAAPPPLLDQLALGGRLVLPVGPSGFQHLEVWRRTDEGCVHTDLLEVSFVPLHGKHGWK